MFEQTFKNIDDILHKDAGCSSELDYVEQTSWVLFLKYLDDFEKVRQAHAELRGETHKPIIQKKFRWTVWAAPKLMNGESIGTVSRTALIAVPVATTDLETEISNQSAKESAVSIAGITTTDLHAGILGLAYLKHRPQKRNHLGRIKGEKITYLVESIVGIELGRNPIKYAAGPFDGKALERMEKRAKEARFFEVSLQEDRYVFTPEANFDDLIQKTKRCLGEKLKEVEELIAVMARMSSKKAEVFATTYAAWNNLLILGKTCSEQAIIIEATENWHPKKLRISKEKFANSIKWIRENGYVPNGRGKLVLPKE